MTSFAARLRDTDRVLYTMATGDVLSSQIVENAGFDYLSISGLANEAQSLGAPDVGLTTVTDLALVASRIVRATSLPVICDADTGFGGIANLTQTVRLFEDAGLAAMHFEDQTTPKRCGALPGKTVIEAEQFAAKVRAAVQARRNPDFTIIARTDAKALGLDEVIRRLNLYAEAGADALILGDFYTLEEYREMTSRLTRPLIAIAADRDNLDAQPYLSAEDWEASGVKAVVFWHALLFGAIRTMQRMATTVQAEKTTRNVEDDICSYAEYGQIVGVDRWLSLESEFGGRECVAGDPGE